VEGHSEGRSCTGLTVQGIEWLFKNQSQAYILSTSFEKVTKLFPGEVWLWLKTLYAYLSKILTETVKLAYRREETFMEKCINMLEKKNPL
jgi:hypothetical protein